MLVTIMRGPPGSGKTWWHTHQLKKGIDSGVVVVDANSFFIENGEYRFDIERIHEAHEWCLRNFVEALLSKNNRPRHLIVDNTNVSAVSIAPYVSLAEAYNEGYQIVRMEPRLTDLEMAKYCVHKVPAETVSRMMRSMERLPPFWNREIVVREWK